jgi:thiamine transport system ATP-binding protein
MSLSVHGLTVRYRSVAAVSDVDLSVADGSVVALLGPSGCGKSTLLRAVAGLEPAAAGRVCWDGVDLAGVPVHRREFGLVFQDGQLFPHRSVAGNVAFGLRMRGVARAARQARVAELLELVGLAGYETRRATELSGGEQQRVALARALAPRPRLLLLDEPLSALDRALREQLAIDLARVLVGSTALVVTHDHDEAFTLADRVAVMRAGRIVQVGPPTEVWRRPADAETARFLGCGELLPATVHNGVASCELGDVALPWAPPGEAVLGLRPTALRPAGSGVKGEVLARVHRRDHVRLRVRLETGREVDAVAGVLDTDDTVTLALDPDGVALVAEPQPSRVTIRASASE